MRAEVTRIAAQPYQRRLNLLKQARGRQRARSAWQCRRVPAARWPVQYPQRSSMSATAVQRCSLG
eukprot:2778655-Alexandrium_andersonii.AAC.1